VLGQFTGGDVSENVLPPLLNIPDNSGLLIVASGRGLRQNVLLRFWGNTHLSPHATIWRGLERLASTQRVGNKGNQPAETADFHTDSIRLARYGELHKSRKVTNQHNFSSTANNA
jgi:hypothetical protein